MRKTLIAAALVLLVSCAQRIAETPAVAVPQPRPFNAPSSWSLLVSNREAMDGSWQFTNLDGANLKDGAIAFAGQGWVVASADGSTVVELDYPSNLPITARVVDARTGVQRASFHPSVGAGPLLTSDGGRLLVLASSGRGWQVFDTTTGRLVGKVEDDANPCCGALDFSIDPTGQFLYRALDSGSGMSATGPVTPVLLQYDLKAGHEIRRLTLTGVQAGLWPGPRMVGAEHVNYITTPGTALSPDGSRFSVIYAEGSRLLTIDTASLKVIASRPLVAPSAATSRFGLMPVEAVAKYEEGVQWTLAYSPDGRRLVASATQLSVDSAGNFSHRGLGVKLIDPQTGTVTAQAPNLEVDQLLYAPDSSAIYAMHRRADGGMSLLRLDSTNLAEAARREYAETRTVLLLAR